MIEFLAETTLDGSPTLRIKQGDQITECMHSPKGALSETLYIYGDAVAELLRRNWPVKILSIGLGLGYNEILSASLMLQAGSRAEGVEITSYESLPQLRNNFLAWILGEDSAAAEASVLFPIYDCVLRKMSEHHQLPPEKVKGLLQGLAKSGAWTVGGSFDPFKENGRRYHCILFDAFSAKTSPELWTDLALQKMLEFYAADKCLISSYAATGPLNRALRGAGFGPSKRPGFSGKRESTYAVREPSHPL